MKKKANSYISRYVEYTFARFPEYASTDRVRIVSYSLRGMVNQKSEPVRFHDQKNLSYHIYETISTIHETKKDAWIKLHVRYVRYYQNRFTVPPNGNTYRDQRLKEWTGRRMGG